MEWILSHYDQFIILGKVAIALILGFMIGLERELKQKPAGLRTNMLIATASALFVMLGVQMIQFYMGILGGTQLNFDPMRGLEAVIVGVSFVGAGAILKQGNKIEHLTTAATILVVAGVGISVALGLYILAVGVTLCVILVNHVLHWIEDRWIHKV